MDTLPSEIRHTIIEKLLLSDFHVRLAPYAAISQNWKASIEHFTFKAIRLHSLDLDPFTTLFDGANIVRRLAMKLLVVDFVLPTFEQEVHPYGGKICCSEYEAPDREADSASFSRSVVKLFTTLKDLEDRAAGTNVVSLSFGYAYRKKKYEEPIIAKQSRRASYYSCGDHDRMYKIQGLTSQFELLESVVLPMLSDVSDFQFCGYGDLEDLKPSWIPRVINCLPNAANISLHFEDEYSLGSIKRANQRNYFSEAVRGLDGQCIQSFEVNVKVQDMGNENAPVQVLLDPKNQEEEPLSAMITHLSTFPCLMRLRLVGGLTLHPDFFRSFIGTRGAAFPELQELVVEFTPETSDGRWFYKRDDDLFDRSRTDPEYEEFWQEYYEDLAERRSSPGSDYGFHVFEEDPIRTELAFQEFYRTLPDEKTFMPFMQGALEAVGSLPKLRKFGLTLEQSDGPICYDFLPFRYFEFWYLVAGTPRSPTGPFWDRSCYPKILYDEKYLGCNRIYWGTEGWTPPEEMQTDWYKLVGPDAKIVFLKKDKYERAKGVPDQFIYTAEF